MNIKIKVKQVLAIILALFLCLILLFSAYTISKWVKNSSVIKSSYFLGDIIKESSVDVKEVLTNPSQQAIIEKYLMALANAYVDFELIPYREAETFKAVITAVNKDVTIESFKYSGKNLIINGQGSIYGILEFSRKLESSDHFARVEVEVNSESEFVIVCYAKEITTPIILS